VTRLLSDCTAVIFDLNGTLLDSVPMDRWSLRQAIATVCRERGVEIPRHPREVYHNPTGLPVEEFYRSLLPPHLLGEETRLRHVRHQLEKEFVEGGRLKAFPHAEECVEALAGIGYRLFLASKCSGRYLELISRGLPQLFARFERLFCREELPGGDKTSMLEEVLRQTGVSAAFMVGDRLSDIRAAHKNGLWAIGCSFGVAEGDEMEEADFRIDSLAAVPEILAPRNLVLEDTARLVMEAHSRLDRDRPLVVGVSGIDTAGKTSFARELRLRLAEKGVPVLQVSLDDFHHPREIRLRDSEDLPRAYYRDTFDFARFEKEILSPLCDSASSKPVRLRWHAFDLEKDSPAGMNECIVAPDAIVLTEGVFLFRREWLDYFDYRIWLAIEPETCLARAADRDSDIFGGREATVARYRRKYLPGQNLYLAEDEPQARAHLVLDNNALDRPRIIARTGTRG